jgi:hypothetical protein
MENNRLKQELVIFKVISRKKGEGGGMTHNPKINAENDMYWDNDKSQRITMMKQQYEKLKRCT